MKNTKNTDYVAVIPLYPSSLFFVKYHINNNELDYTHYLRVQLNISNINKYSPIWLIVSNKAFKGSYCYNKTKIICHNSNFRYICNKGLKRALKAVKANPKLIDLISDKKQKNIYIQTLVAYDK